MVIAEELRQTIGARYSIEREISRSAMACVFLARDQKHDRLVAIKTIGRGNADPAGVHRFLREIRLIAQFQHPHILPLFDSGESAESLFYVMPFVEGETLREFLSRSGRLAIDDAVRITREVCDALAYAHSRGIVHRDIKPENILLASGHALLFDFGIAHVQGVKTGGVTTESGIVMGTPAYMSPEQVAGDPDVDARSDIYSLACVLYEMLTGQRPHVADTPQAALIKRLHVSPPSPRDQRADLPDALERAVVCALAIARENRFQSASEFAAALRGSAPSTPGPLRPTERLSRTKFVVAIGTRRLAAVVGVLVVSAAVALGWRVFSPPTYDPALYAVLPFATSGVPSVDSVRGDEVARLVVDALGQWRGLRLVDDMRVRDVVARDTRREPTLRASLAAARRLGAGRLVWGEVAPRGQALALRVSLYDVNRDGELVHTTTQIAPSFGDLSRAIDSIAGSVLGEVAGSPSDVAGAGTRDVAALRAYTHGQRELDAWNLDSAAALFSLATQRDPAFARAHFLAAQTQVWRANVPRSVWSRAAERAVALSAQLNPRERVLAQALLALSAEEYELACARYAALLASDSLDFAAWFGRGECLSRDRVVLPDRGSPSGWRFRSSQQAAVTAFRRSLMLVPSFQSAFGAAGVQRLEGLLLAVPNEFLVGYAATPDSQRFGAYPALIADTLALVPYPIDDFLAAKAGTRPATLMAAFDHNREILRQLTKQWAADAPGNATAHANYAIALENVGVIDTLGSASALGEIVRARSLAIALADQLLFSETHLRLLLKLARYEAAKALADTMLTAAARAQGPEAKSGAAAAVLTGRVQQAVHLLQVAIRAESLWTPHATISYPVTVADPALELTVYAASGAPASVVRPIVERAEDAIESWMRADLAGDLRRALLYRPVALAYLETGVTRTRTAFASEDHHLAMQLALARHDTATTREFLRGVARDLAQGRPGEMGLEFVLIAANASLALGDSAAARAGVALALAALRNAGRVLTEDASSPAALVRLLALHAELAAAGRYAPAAASSARAVVTLWRDADPVLAATVSKMKRLAALAPP